jgi:CBS domain-containing protein
MKKSELKKLTAQDVMERNLVVVYDRDTLRQALELMTSNHVTGLPVVNSHEVCVGLISASDILNYEQENSELNADASENASRYFNQDTQQWESIRPSSFAMEAFGDVRVEEVMTRELISVTPETPLREVARVIRDGRVHRVLVLTAQQRLLGIISAFDFVRLAADLE